MFDMPPALVQPAAFGWADVESAAGDYQPAVRVMRETWDKESLLSIMQGKIAVPDSVINDAMAERLTPDGSVTEVKVASQADGRLKINARTKSIGAVEFSGTIDDFVHTADESYMTYHIKERALLDQGTLSWFFSRIPLSMTEKLFGKLSVTDDLPLQIHGNTVRVDFQQVLLQSELGRTEYGGHRLIDMLEIEKAEPKDGYVEFSTRFNVPLEVKMMLLRTLI